MKNWKYVKETKKIFNVYTGEAEPNRDSHYIYEGDKLIAVLASWEHDPRDFPLVAAAPQLLEALEGMMEFVTDDPELDDFDAVVNAKAAIRKAKGIEI